MHPMKSWMLLSCSTLLSLACALQAQAADVSDLMAIAVIQQTLDCEQAYPKLKAELETSFEDFIQGNHTYVSVDQWRLLKSRLKAHPTQSTQEACVQSLAKFKKFDNLISNMVASEQVLKLVSEQGGDRSAVGMALDDWARVVELVPDSPADRAGVKVGDKVVSVNGRPMAGAALVRLAILQATPGSVVKLGLLRETKAVSVDVMVTKANKLR
jgi:C-terminal processing protease CtpA/Prc